MLLSLSLPFTTLPGNSHLDIQTSLSNSRPVSQALSHVLVCVSLWSQAPGLTNSIPDPIMSDDGRASKDDPTIIKVHC